MSENDPQDTQNPDPAQNPDKAAQSREEAARGARTGSSGDEELGRVRREAADRRRQLREVEAERDALRTRLDERDRQDVERMATDRLADPADLWLSTSLDAMRSVDGTIDMAKAEAELQKLVKEKPHWAKVEPTNLHQGARESEPERESSFGASVKRALRG